MIGELIYSVEVAIVRCPGRRDGARRRAGREADDGPLLRHLPALGRERLDAHLLAQLATAAVGPAHGAGAGRAAMRIYLAARYDRRFEMLGVAAGLMRAGHDVTSRWIEGRSRGRPELVAALEDVGDLAAPTAWSPSPRTRSEAWPGRRAAAGTSSSASRWRPGSGSAWSVRARTSSTTCRSVEVVRDRRGPDRGADRPAEGGVMTAWGVAPARGRLRICGTCGATAGVRRGRAAPGRRRRPSCGMLRARSRSTSVLRRVAANA